MGILSDLFKKEQEPEPYDWDFLKRLCFTRLGEVPSGARIVFTGLGQVDLTVKCLPEAGNELRPDKAGFPQSPVDFLPLRGAQRAEASVRFQFHAGHDLRPRLDLVRRALNR